MATSGCVLVASRWMSSGRLATECLCTHLLIPRRGKQLYSSNKYHRSLALVTNPTSAPGDNVTGCDHFVPAVVVDFRDAGMLEMQCGPQGGLLVVAWQVNLAGSGSRALAYFLTCPIYLPVQSFAAVHAAAAAVPGLA